MNGDDYEAQIGKPWMKCSVLSLNQALFLMFNENKQT